MRKRILRTNESSRRRGAALIAAMIAVLLASAVGTILLKTALAQRRTAIREQRRQQSIWLAESAIERAAAKLSRDAAYTGETWTIPAAELGGRGGARVVIKASRTPSASGTLRTVSVTAEYPLDSPHRSRTTKTVTIDVDAFHKPKTEPNANPEKKNP
jgi:Tfp pilus assembly protein PilX